MFLLAFAVSLLVWNIEAEAAGPSFVYDSLGRLVTVYDASGNAAVYKYDAVGNLLSITNSSSTTFAALELSSSSGIAGSTVTIYGTGFCSNPTVTFNGVAATVVSAATTQIVVTVPSNATTGSVVVTCGSNQSNVGTFTVSAAGLPSITGFTPTIGTAGTSVTINGANFAAAASDEVRFNVNLAAATSISATPTVITATAPPNVTTGHITVGTPAGQVVSSGYFFVPPPPLTVSQIGFTGSTTISTTMPGAPVTATISTAGTSALVAFDGTAGQPVSLNMTNSNFPGCFGQVQVTVTVYRPDGVVLASISPCFASAIISDLVLPITGTYAILVTPARSNTGQMTLAVYSTPDVTGTIAVGGSAVTIANAVPGQDMSLTFTGTANTPISLNLTNTTFPGCFGQVQVTITILNPDGSQLAQMTPCFASQVLPDITLPQNGTYTMFIDPNGANVGSMTLQIYNTPDVAVPITLGGVPVSVSNTVAGQDMRLSFSATAGQTTTLNMTGSTFPGCFGAVQVTVSLLDPNNNTLASMTPCGASATMGPVALPSTGTYSIFVDPAGQNVGGMTLQLWNESDLSGTVNTTDTYGHAVLGDAVQSYWRVDETSPATAANAVAAIRDGVSGPTVPDTAVTLNGASYVSTANLVAPPGSFTLEAWLKTTSISGGTLVGFNSSQTTNPAYWDRALYLSNSGNLVFGVWNGSGITSVSSPSAYNDGNWHYVAATFTNGGQLSLYVDGTSVASSAGSTTDNSGWSGYWHIGWTTYASNWPSVPVNYNFQGSLSEVAVWNSSALTSTQIANHYGAAKGGSYDNTVLGDAPSSYWKLNESSGGTFADATVNANVGTARTIALNATYLGGVTLGAPGVNIGHYAVTLDGSTGYLGSGVPSGAPGTFTLEAWFKTSTTQGGTLMGFNDSPVNAPSKWDRALYLSNSGNLVFGVWNGSGITSVSSPSTYNNGNWHYVAATFTNGGQLSLYVDGTSVASSTGSTTDNSGWSGYWHIGWTTYASNWPSIPSSYYFGGTIDEPAVYPYALSSAQVSNHYLSR